MNYIQSLNDLCAIIEVFWQVKTHLDLDFTVCLITARQRVLNIFADVLYQNIKTGELWWFVSSEARTARMLNPDFQVATRSLLRVDWQSYGHAVYEFRNVVYSYSQVRDYLQGNYCTGYNSIARRLGRTSGSLDAVESTRQCAQWSAKRCQVRVEVVHEGICQTNIDALLPCAWIDLQQRLNSARDGIFQWI